MKKYMEPEMEIVEISRNDVIVTSPGEVKATNTSGGGMPGMPGGGHGGTGDADADCCGN